jgi:hypothetical protein
MHVQVKYVVDWMLALTTLSVRLCAHAAGVGGVYHTSIKALETWLAKLHAPPALTRLLIALLNDTRHNMMTIITIEDHSSVQQMEQAQDGIGWVALSNGNMSLLWKEIQHHHDISIGRHNTGERWVRPLIQKIWDVAWDQGNPRNNVLHNQENLVSIS